MKAKKGKGSLSRRRFLERCAASAGSTSIIALLLAAGAREAKSTPAWAIRPPGAIDEQEFTSACVRCGLCVRACPYHILRLSELDQDVALGTPYFIARQAPCEMCKDIPCAKSCPTDALSKSLTDIRDADMGLAVFTGADTCYSVTGAAACRACYLACPVKDRAITMELHQNSDLMYFQPTVHAEHCTGCGRCEKHCATEEASIKVLPRALAKRDRAWPEGA